MSREKSKVSRLNKTRKRVDATDAKTKNTVIDARKSKEKKKKNRETSFFGKFVGIIERKSAIRHDRLHNILAKFGKTQFEISSKYGVRALAAISKICRVSDVQTTSEGVRFFIDSKHCDKIIALLDNLCYDYKIIRIGGVVPFALRTVARFGVVVGICVGVAAFAIYSSFVTRVSVRYAGAVEPNEALKRQISDILCEYGAESGAKASDIDGNELEKTLTELDGVAFASVKRNGTHFDIVIKSELPKESFAQMQGSSVKATKTAVVTRIIVEGGTAIKKYGDVVKAGDVLIDGFVEYGDSKIPSLARGYAFGKVYYKKSVYFPAEDTVKEYGEQKTLTRLGMFGKVPKTPQSPYECYELATSVRDYGFMLPMKIYEYTFRQLTIRKVENNLDEESMKRKAFSVLATEFEESAKVLNVYYEVKNVDGGVVVDITVEAEESIA